MILTDLKTVDVTEKKGVERGRMKGCAEGGQGTKRAVAPQMMIM
jgi:hypothetical protein